MHFISLSKYLLHLIFSWSIRDYVVKLRIVRIVLVFIPLLFSVDMTEDGLKAVMRLSKGDMRRSLNILQVIFVAVSV